jgi:uncharacterized protein YegL
MMRRPGGELATRPLHFIWITDCSGSMKTGGKIQALNTAIREAVPHMARVADENPNAEVLVRAIKFSSGAQWHVAQEIPVAQFKWDDLSAGGSTDMGKALSMVADQLKIPPMSERALPPVLVLVSDGQPTDNFNKGLAALMDEPWGKKAVRIAIAIGEDADLEVLRRFIAHPEIEPLQANNPEALVDYIKWVSTAVLQAASSPASQTAASASSVGTGAGAAAGAQLTISQSAPVGQPISQGANVPVPVPVMAGAGGPVAAADVW